MTVIPKLLCFMFIFGIAFLSEPLFKDIMYIIRKKIRLKKHLLHVKNKKNIEQVSEFEKHLYMLIGATIRTKNPKSAYIFVIVSGIISVVTFTLCSFILPINIAIFVMLISTSMPYILLRTKLQSIRVLNSREGDTLISELLNSYKISYYNMQEAIKLTAENLEPNANCKKLLYNLAKGFNKAATTLEIKELLDTFRFSIDTSWANVLATNIYFAQTNGIKVTNSLSDLLASISKSKRVIEHSRRENNEANLMLKYLVPICYLLTVIGACKYFGFTFRKFLIYQFGTTTGLTWILAIIGLYLLGIVINVFLSREKMDL